MDYRVAEQRIISIVELEPAEYNPRKQLQPGDEEYEKIKRSIERFGFADPVVVNKDMTIIGGHQRINVALDLGYTEVPCAVVDLDKDDEKALNIALNKISGEWDNEKLSDLLQGLSLGGYDTTLTGFSDNERDTLLDGVKLEPGVHEDEFDVDAALDSEQDSRIALGQIYALGSHRLMCGDSTDAAAWQRLMDGEKADMVFTDPPYGVSIGDKNAMLNSVQKAGRCCENIANDTISETELYDVLKSAFINVRNNCKDDASYFVTSPQGGSLGLMMMMMMKDAGLEVRHILMWRKNSATFSLGRLDYDYQHEPIFYTWTKSHHNYRKGKYRTTIWDFDKPRKCDLHPTMKPVELVVNAIMDGTRENDIVLDAFCGSGTTIIACEQTGRQARAMELDPKYCQVIIRRWEEYTGEKAVLVE